MFKQLWKLLRVMGLALTGRIVEARKVWNTNPHAIRANFEDLIAKARENALARAEAASSTKMQVAKKKAELKKKTEARNKASRIMTGALKAAKARAAELQAEGKTPEEIKQDPDYLRHQSAYTTKREVVGKDEERIAQLERGIAERTKKYEGQVRDLAKAKDRIEQLREKADDLVSRAIKVSWGTKTQHPDAVLRFDTSVLR